MNRIYYTISLAFCAILTAVSCKSSGGGNTISGKAGEVIVVTAEAVWNSKAGDMLRDSLMRECPALPQHEPMYTLVHVPNGSFTRMFRIHRNIICLNVSAKVEGARFVIKRDPWAHPQILFYVDAPDIGTACSLLAENMGGILSGLETIERERVITDTGNFSEPSLTAKTESFIGASMMFPNGFSLKKETEDFLWISNETKYVQQGFFIYSSPATCAADELSAESLTALRNRVLKKNVPGGRKGSYMTTVQYLVPQAKMIEHDGIRACETRGLWELVNDYMGGPFVSQSFYTPDSTRIVTVEAYVYAPKHDKRIYMRQGESLLYSFKWK